MAIRKTTLDDLLAEREPQAVFSKDGLFDERTMEETSLADGLSRDLPPFEGSKPSRQRRLADV